MRSFLENSTACRKSVPFFGVVVASGGPFVGLVGVVVASGFGIQIYNCFLLVVCLVSGLNSCPSQGGSGSSKISQPSGWWS